MDVANGQLTSDGGVKHKVGSLTFTSSVVECTI